MPEFLSAFWERLAEIHQQEWRQVSGAAVAGVALFAAVILYYTHSGQGWVFPIDNANLAFHEFGHPFFGAFSSRLTVGGPSSSTTTHAPGQYGLSPGLAVRKIDE